MFVGLHAAIAMKTNTPELMIDDKEGADFMKSAQNVLRHYSVEATQATLDWIAFIGCAVGMYAPRVVAIGVRRQTERGGPGRRAPAAKVEGNVFTPDAWQGGVPQEFPEGFPAE